MHSSQHAVLAGKFYVMKRHARGLSNALQAGPFETHAAAERARLSLVAPWPADCETWQAPIADSAEGC